MIRIIQPETSWCCEKTITVEFDADGDLSIYNDSEFEFMLDRNRALELMAALDILISHYDGEQVDEDS